MKFFALFIVAILLSACATVPNENHQQAYDTDLAQGRLMITTLRALDTGDITKTRLVPLNSLYTTLFFLPFHAAEIHPTAEQKQEELALAREVLDYMLLHRNELDPGSLSLRMGMAGLRSILTEPGDTPRLKELSDYLSGAEKKASGTTNP
jgi:hypothetical protein